MVMPKQRWPRDFDLPPVVPAPTFSAAEDKCIVRAGENKKTMVLGHTQTWMGLCPGASHWIGVLTDTATGKEIQSEHKFDERKDALAWCLTKYLEAYDMRKTVLLIGSMSDYCAL